MSKLIRLCLGAVAFIPVAAFSSHISSHIDFETIPGDAPAEGLAINTQFLASDGITFSLAGGGSPVLADYGGNRTAFFGPAGGSDNLDVSETADVGSWFLTDDGLVSGGLNPTTLIVTYATPTAQASGVILDIDGNGGEVETFTIEAFDGSNNSLAMQSFTFGDPDTGDGIATQWMFDIGADLIASIHFTGIRSPSGGFGLGFDNFNARSIVPLPAAAWLLLSGLIGFVTVGRRKKVV